MIKIGVGKYRLSPYGGYRAWMIEKKHKNGRWRPFKYPGDLTQAVEGMLAILLQEPGAEEFEDSWEGVRQRIDEAVDTLEEAIAQAGIEATREANED